MPKYQKKPTVVDAEIWQPGKRLPNVLIDGDNGFPGSMNNPDPEDENRTIPYPKDHGFISCDGKLGLDVHPGWWVVQLPDKTAFTCDPETFERIYESAPPAEAPDWQSMDRSTFIGDPSDPGPPAVKAEVAFVDPKSGQPTIVRCPRCRTSFRR